MANPYSDGNPYITRKAPNTSGQQLANLGMKLYTLKNAAGGKETRWKIGGSKAGEPLEIPDPTTETSNLFGKGGEQAVSPAAEEASLSAFDFSGGGVESAFGEQIGTETGAAAYDGLSAFDLGGGIESGYGFEEQIGAASEAGGGIESGLGFADQIGAASEYGGGIEAGYGFAGEIGAETGGATLSSALGTVGSAASTAMPYIALARVGMPIVGRAMKSLPGHENETVLGQMADLTQKDYMRPMERLTELAFTGGKALPKWTGIFNPGGYLLKRCIIVSACTSRDSYEVNVARKFRDRYMDEETLTGYYALCVFIVPFIHKHRLFKRIVKSALVDRLVDYGEWRMEMKPAMRFSTSRFVKRTFLGLCRHVGRGVDTVLEGQEV
jgi:hypothetical protein